MYIIFIYKYAHIKTICDYSVDYFQIFDQIENIWSTIRLSIRATIWLPTEYQILIPNIQLFGKYIWYNRILNYSVATSILIHFY